MTPEAKQLKLSSIAGMFAGLAVCIFGVVLIVTEFDFTDLVPLVTGGAAAVLGAQGARAANVPSTAKRLLPAALAIVIGCVAAGVITYLIDHDKVMACVAAGVAAVAALAVLVGINAVKRALERI